MHFQVIDLLKEAAKQAHQMITPHRLIEVLITVILMLKRQLMTFSLMKKMMPPKAVLREHPKAPMIEQATGGIVGKKMKTVIDIKVLRG